MERLKEPVLALAVAILFAPILASAQNLCPPTWTTQETLPDGNRIILYWTGVYEGLDSLYQIKIGDNIIDLGKQKAAGQPVFNLKHNLIALPYCADDGCMPKVNIIDLTERKILPPIELNYEGQFYIECKWEGTILVIQVEHEPWDKTDRSYDIHKYNVTSKGIVPYPK